MTGESATEKPSGRKTTANANPVNALRQEELKSPTAAAATARRSAPAGSSWPNTSPRSSPNPYPNPPDNLSGPVTGTGQGGPARGRDERATARCAVTANRRPIGDVTDAWFSLGLGSAGRAGGRWPLSAQGS
jgi:hypothetical protein